MGSIPRGAAAMDVACPDSWSSLQTLTLSVSLALSGNARTRMAQRRMLRQARRGAGKCAAYATNAKLKGKTLLTTAGEMERKAMAVGMPWDGAGVDQRGRGN
jgi:hypothetical protein